MLVDSLNHVNAIMKPDNNMYIRISGKFVAPCFAPVRPIRPFRGDLINTILLRRLLTEIAMLGIGENVGIIRESAINVEEALSGDGILRLNFNLPHNKRYSPKKLNTQPLMLMLGWNMITKRKPHWTVTSPFVRYSFCIYAADAIFPIDLTQRHGGTENDALLSSCASPLCFL
jgi:hypothetical protein